MSDNKRTDEELQELLRGCPEPGTPWVHYKTKNLYWVQMCAIKEDTQEPMVVYHRQDSPLMFARPLSEWVEYLSDHEVRRFEPVAKKSRGESE